MGTRDEVDYWRRFVNRHVRSPIKPELNYKNRKVLSATNVVAGVDMGKRACTSLVAKLDAFAQIEFTGGVVRCTNFPDPLERLRRPNHPSNKRRDNTLLMFPSGKGRVSGATSVVCAITAFHTMRFTQYELGYDCDFKDFRVDNIATSGNLGYPLALATLQQYHDEYGIAWRPKDFPGAVCYALEYKVVNLMFETSELIGVGFKSIKQIPAVDAWLCKMGEPFKDLDTSHQVGKGVQRCIRKQVATANKRRSEVIKDAPIIGQRLLDNITNRGGVHTTQDLKETIEAIDLGNKPSAVGKKRSLDTSDVLLEEAGGDNKRVLDEVEEWEDDL